MEVGCLESNLSTLWLFLCQTNVDLESLLRVRFGIGRERPVSMGTAAVSNSNVCVAAYAPMIDREQGLLASRVMALGGRYSYTAAQYFFRSDSLRIQYAVL